MSRLLFDMGAKSMTALDKVGRSNAGTLPERYCGGGSGGEGNQPASECAAAPQEQGQSSSGSVGCCGQALVGGGRAIRLSTYATAKWGAIQHGCFNEEDGGA